MLSALETLQGANLLTLLIGVIAILIVIKGMWEMLEWGITKLGITTKRQREIEEIAKLAELHDKQFEEILEKLEKIQLAQKESLLSMIDSSYKHFQELGYIPQEEYEQFVALHDAYNSIGGNHIGDMKFERIVNNYDIR